MSEGGFGDALGQKIGPLPGWGWALVVGGGLGLSMLLRKKSTVKVAPSTVPGAVVGGTSGADSGTGSTLTAASDIVPYTDNNTWGLAVETALLQAGAEPTLVDQAVRDYLAGDTLTPAESVLIGQALNKVGPPPELLPPGVSIPSVTDPTSSPTTTTPTPSSIAPSGSGQSTPGLAGPVVSSFKPYTSPLAAAGVPFTEAPATPVTAGGSAETVVYTGTDGKPVTETINLGPGA